VLAVRSLFAYERETDHSLVLAAGIAPEWLEGAGVRVDDLRTAHGAISYTLCRSDSNTLRFAATGASAARIVLRPPLSAPLRSVRLNGENHLDFDANSVTVSQLPADIECRS
jgi:hypothetical protein